MGPRFALYARSIQTLVLNVLGPESEGASEEPEIVRFKLVRPDFISA